MAQAQKTKQQKSKVNPTAQSLIGIFIFALGFAAFIAVLYLGYVRFYKGGNAENSSLEETARAEKTDTIEAYLGEEADQQTMRKASYDEITGQWEAVNNRYTAHFNLTPDRQFQIILFLDPQGYERHISWGRLRYDEEQGVLEFKPSFAPLPDVEDGEIKTLTRREYALMPLYDTSNNTLALVPRIIEGRRDQVHPIFSKMDRSGRFIRLMPRQE
ncbi:MAG: hypothetical protein ACLFR0_01390 [Alphaproteobacteria bacterium]